jgi:hypothetical protein
MDCLQGKEIAKRSRQLVYHIFLILGERFWLSIRQLIDHPLINISRRSRFFLPFLHYTQTSPSDWITNEKTPLPFGFYRHGIKQSPV